MPGTHANKSDAGMKRKTGGEPQLEAGYQMHAANDAFTTDHTHTHLEGCVLYQRVRQRERNVGRPMQGRLDVDRVIKVRLHGSDASQIAPADSHKETSVCRQPSRKDPREKNHRAGSR